MVKKIYVAVNVGNLVGDNSLSGDVPELIRIVDKKYMGKTFYEILEKMTDTKKDECQDKNYDETETKYAKSIEKILSNGDLQKGTASLIAIKNRNTEQKKEIYVNHKKTPSDYEGIMNQEELDTGEPIDGIDLLIINRSVGGYCHNPIRS